MLRTGLIAAALVLAGPAAALVLAGPAARAERPPIQEMRLPPLTAPGQPQPQAQSPPRPQGPLQSPPLRPSPGLPAGLANGPTQLQPPVAAQSTPTPGGQTPDQNTAQTPPAAETPTGPPGVSQDQPEAASVPVQPQWPNQWVPQGSARLQALDKVNAQATTLTVKIGQPATFGSLTITVKACVVRPPDQPADAAAYLDVVDGHPDSPGFDGWMLANEPAVSMMQNPIYDLRVAGCA